MNPSPNCKTSFCTIAVCLGLYNSYYLHYVLYSRVYVPLSVPVYVHSYTYTYICLCLFVKMQAKQIWELATCLELEVILSGNVVHIVGLTFDPLKLKELNRCEIQQFCKPDAQQARLEVLHLFAISVSYGSCWCYYKVDAYFTMLSEWGTQLESSSGDTLPCIKFTLLRMLAQLCRESLSWQMIFKLTAFIYVFVYVLFI